MILVAVIRMDNSPDKEFLTEINLKDYPYAV